MTAPRMSPETERLRHNVSSAMDELGDVATDADVESGRWQGAFAAAWEGINALVRAAEREAADEARAETLRLVGATDLRQVLAGFMSDLSEECYCAGWLIDCEHVLWDLAHEGGGKWGVGEVTKEHADRLLDLSRALGGWMVWDDGAKFMPLAEWERHHEGSSYMTWKKSGGGQ